MKKKFSLNKNSLGYYEISPKPSAMELSQYYAQKYYQENSGSYQHNYPEEELRYFQLSAEIALATLRKYQTSATPNLLDLGCGEGFFANFFCRENWKTTLVDFSDDGLRRHNPSLIANFIQADLTTYIEKNQENIEAFGLINLDNVLEHVLDPVELLASLKSCMHSNALLRIEVSNDFSSFQDLLLTLGCTEETWVRPPEHLSYFNTDSLKALVENQGFELVSLQADFPIEQFLVNEHSNYWKNRELGGGAHRTRIVVTNYLASKDLNRLIDYQEAAADLEFGRSLTAYVRVTR
ncbi:MAG: hypothetical protein CMC95_04325 [Flavobacteriales bacterium]|nr:hypothetical protein [Flavobacteriales bacterium]|tara:strand:+ start:538 stop:1419 length:882 start_codon:yes stop_codon:yes gene_type:complete